MQEDAIGKSSELTPTVKALLGDAAKKLTAHRRRAFMANVTVELLGGSARRAETHFGWSRHTVELGLHERASGIICMDNFPARGNKKMEAKRPELERDIRALADPHSQADPQFKSALSYTRLSAASVRRALIAEKGWREEDLPAPRTMNTLLNRLGYRLRSVAKTRPEKNRTHRSHLRQRPSGQRGGGRRPRVPAPERGHQGQRGAGRLLTGRKGARTGGGARARP